VSQLECGGVWVECVEHTPQLHVIGGGEAPCLIQMTFPIHAWDFQKKREVKRESA
jgi:hypothetical protein